MKEQNEIKNKFERTRKALTLKPSLGRDTGVSKTRIISGLSCETKEGDWVFKTDMPKQVGGTGTASSPGALGRAACSHRAVGVAGGEADRCSDLAGARSVHRAAEVVAGSLLV